MNNIEVNNEKGYTLFETIISIAVGSIVLLMLTQMLVMNISVRKRIQEENVLFNQSTSVVDNLQEELFSLQPHSVELIEDTSTRTVIHFIHEYDITVDPVSGAVTKNYDNPVTHELIYDKVNERITYNGSLLHNGTTKILLGSSITILRLDEDTCAITPDAPVCSEGVLKLNLIITKELASGNRLESLQFCSNVII